MRGSTAKILQFNKPLLQDMVQVKYALMRQDLYRFFRGTCHLFYDRLSKEKDIPFSPVTWICGDLHLENFGSYKGDNRLVYFDLNDFDEAVLAPASWELIRIVSSIFIAFDTIGIERKKALNMAKLFLRVYSQVLAGGKAYYIEPKTATGIVCTFLKAVSKRGQKVLLKKRTVVKKKKRVLKVSKKHRPLDPVLKAELFEHLNEWVANNSGRPYNYEVVDAVFRIAGTGSLGLKRYLLLLKSTNLKEQYLVVDMKQSKASSLAPYVPVPQPEWASESERILAVQQRMQNISPALLSTTVFKGEPFVIQELQPTKDSINLSLIKNRYRDIYQAINDMAVLTASAQLRSTGRQGSASADELIAFGQSESWQRPVINYAIGHALRVKKDYIKFCEQIPA